MNPTATRRLGWLLIVLGVAIAVAGIGIFRALPNMCSNDGQQGFLYCLPYPNSFRYRFLVPSLLVGIVQVVWGVRLIIQVGRKSEADLPNRIAVLAFIGIVVELGWLAWIAYEGLTRYVH